MFTKAEIQSIDYTSNTCLVRIPLFENAASNFPVILEAQMTCLPGIHSGYMKGDKVWVSFETDLYDKPIVIGKMYLGVKNEQKTTGGAVQASTLTVEDTAILPAETTFTGIETYNSIKKIQDKLINLDAGRGDDSKNRTYLTKLTIDELPTIDKNKILPNPNAVINLDTSISTTKISYYGMRYMLTNNASVIKRSAYCGIIIDKKLFSGKQKLQISYIAESLPKQTNLIFKIGISDNYTTLEPIEPEVETGTLINRNNLSGIVELNYDFDKLSGIEHACICLYLSDPRQVTGKECSIFISNIVFSSEKPGKTNTVYLNTNNYYSDNGANNKVNNLLTNINIAGNNIPAVMLDNEIINCLISYDEIGGNKIVKLCTGAQAEQSWTLSDKVVASCQSQDTTQL